MKDWQRISSVTGRSVYFLLDRSGHRVQFTPTDDISFCCVVDGCVAMRVLGVAAFWLSDTERNRVFSVVIRLKAGLIKKLTGTWQALIVCVRRDHSTARLLCIN